MRELLIVLLGIASLCVFAACNPDNQDCIADNCMGFPPSTARLTLQLTINDENRNVPVEIFTGSYNDPNRRVFIRDTVPYFDLNSNNEVAYDLPVQRWNVAVTYIHEGRRVVAIDSRKLDIDYLDECQGIQCYSPVNRDIDMRLKIRD